MQSPTPTSGRGGWQQQEVNSHWGDTDRDVGAGVGKGQQTEPLSGENQHSRFLPSLRNRPWVTETSKGTIQNPKVAENFPADHCGHEERGTHSDSPKHLGRKARFSRESRPETTKIIGNKNKLSPCPVPVGGLQMSWGYHLNPPLLPYPKNGSQPLSSSQARPASTPHWSRVVHSGS